MNPPTIADALAQPDRWLPALPAQVPDIAPLTGLVALDPVAVELYGPTDVDFDDAEDRRRFTEVLLGAASPATLTGYLTLSQLRDDWTSLELPTVQRLRWERAFPGLRIGGGA